MFFQTMTTTSACENNVSPVLNNKFIVLEMANPVSSDEHHSLIHQVVSLLKAKGYLSLVVDFPENSLHTTLFNSARIWEENLLVPYDFDFFYTCLSLFYRYCKAIRKALSNKRQPVCVVALRYSYRYPLLLLDSFYSATSTSPANEILVFFTALGPAPSSRASRTAVPKSIVTTATFQNQISTSSSSTRQILLSRNKWNTTLMNIPIAVFGRGMKTLSLYMHKIL